MLPTGSSPAPAGRSSARDRISESLEAVLFLAAAAAMPVFVFAGIGRSLWLDEANSISIADGGLLTIFSRLKIDNNFPVYYILLHFWALLFGESEAALRLLSGLFYIATTAAVYLGGRWLFRDRRAALYAAFFYSVSTQAVRQAQNIRMYAMLGLLSALSIILFCGIFGAEPRPGRKWVWYTGVNAIGALTHLWFAFVLIGQGAALVWWRRAKLKSFLIAGLASGLPFLLLWSPALWAQLQNGATRWMPKFEAMFVAHAVMDFYGGPAGLLFYAACAYLIFHYPKRKLGGGTLARLLLTCFGVSLALPLAISVFKPIFWPGRYTIIALPPLALWLGATLARSAPRPALAVFCYLTLGVVLGVHLWSRDLNSESGLPEPKSDKAAAQFLMGLAKPGDALVFTSLSRPAIDYYLRRAGASSRFMEIGFPAETSVHLGWEDTHLDDRRRTALQAEAEGAVSRLAALPAGSRILVLYGADLRVSAVLKNELDRRLGFQRAIPLAGPYYTKVLEYSP